jgi:hypothetical protein
MEVVAPRIDTMPCLPRGSPAAAAVVLLLNITSLSSECRQEIEHLIYRSYWWEVALGCLEVVKALGSV